MTTTKTTTGDDPVQEADAADTSAAGNVKQTDDSKPPEQDDYGLSEDEAARAAVLVNPEYERALRDAHDRADTADIESLTREHDQWRADRIRTLDQRAADEKAANA